MSVRDLGPSQTNQSGQRTHPCQDLSAGPNVSAMTACGNGWLTTRSGHLASTGLVPHNLPFDLFDEMPRQKLPKKLLLIWRVGCRVRGSPNRFPQRAPKAERIPVACIV